MNRFRHFIPLMHEAEYKFIENTLCSNDVLLKWGSGNSTIYFSGIVKKVISIEHDIDWIKVIKNVIRGYNISNIDIHHIPAHSPDPVPCRYEQFKEYIHYPVKNNFFFTKVLIDGRLKTFGPNPPSKYGLNDIIGLASLSVPPVIGWFGQTIA